MSTKKAYSWNIELVERMIDLHTIQLMKLGGTHGERQALKALRKTISPRESLNKDLFEQADYLGKVFVYLRYAFLDPATRTADYETFLTLYLDTLEEFNISQHFSSPLHILFSWAFVFRTQLSIRKGEWERARLEVLSARQAVSRDARYLAETMNTLNYRLILRSGYVESPDDIFNLLVSSKERISYTNGLVLQAEYSMLWPERELQHAENIEKLHPWLLKSYTWAFENYRNPKVDRDFIKRVTGDRIYRQPKFYLEMYLKVLCANDTKLLKALPKLDTIRRFDPDAVKNGGRDADIFDFLNKVEQIKAESFSSEALVARYETLLSTCNRFRNAQLQLQGYAALSAVAKNLKHRYLAHHFARKYAECSLRFTKGQNGNILELPEQSHGPVYELMPLTDSGTERIDKVREGITERFSMVARLVTEIAVERVKGSTKKLFANEKKKDQIDRELLQRNAEILVKALGQLKGPYMKVGQLISTVALSLPEGIDSEMNKLLDSTIPLETNVVKKIIEQEIQAPISDVFEDFHDHPLASASIGQIHRARLKTGEEVVVKVQYPEITNIVKNDGKIAYMLVPIYKALFPNVDAKMIIEESNTKLLDECNYLIEKEYQKFAKEISQEYDEIYVPSVFEQWTTEKVFVMEYVEGKRFYEFLSSSTEEQRSRASDAIFRFLLGSYFQHGLVNGDPHPGNFLFMPDGRICVIDYGFSDRTTVERRKKWAKIVMHAYRDDVDSFAEAMKDIGMVADADKFDFQTALKNARAFLVYGLDEEVKVDGAWVQNIIQTFTVKAANRKYMMLDKQEVVSARFLLCIMSILLRLEPRMALGRVYYEVILGFYNQYIDDPIDKEA